MVFNHFHARNGTSSCFLINSESSSFSHTGPEGRKKMLPSLKLVLPEVFPVYSTNRCQSVTHSGLLCRWVSFYNVSESLRCCCNLDWLEINLMPPIVRIFNDDCKCSYMLMHTFSIYLL